MAEKKQQHVIPNCYLKAWCDPQTPAGQTPYIWRISRDGSTKRKKSPEKSFTANDRYTVKLPTGERNLVVEDTLAGLENAFVAVRKKIENREELTAEDRATLCLFTAAMQSRTIRAGDHWRNTAQQIHDITSSLEQQYGVGPHTSKQTERMVEVAPQYFVMTMLEMQTPIYFQMQISIFVSKDEFGFITSDSPCVWFNPKAHTFPPFYRSPGLAQADIEVTLPLTPQHLLFISHKPNHFYIDVNQAAVDEANRLTRAYCTDEFVSWRGETRPYWFEQGVMPPDAWESTDAGKEALRQRSEREQKIEQWKKRSGKESREP